ncbi:N-acetylglutamate synthase, mitochondrial [Polypterus senegalus]|nr:N-acetylglutamate synthase, mitochondrial [Polypterus senegalus]
MAKVNPGSTIAMANHLLAPTRPSRGTLPQLRRRMSAASGAGLSRNRLTAEAFNEKRLLSSMAAPMAVSRSLSYRDVTAFLEQVGGDPREVRYWLGHFQKCSRSQSPAFAVMEVEEEVFQDKDMVHRLAFGLSFLQRMDMKPVVVLGLTQDLEEESQISHNGRSRLIQICQVLTEALLKNSATVLPFFSGAPLFKVGLMPSNTNGRCEAPITVDTDLLQWSLDCGNIPVVCPIGETASGQSVLLDSLSVTAAISKALEPLKVMFLNATGGIRNTSHKVIGQLNLPADVDLLLGADWINPQEQRRAWLIMDLLNHMPTECSAVITSACTVLTELFSHKGAGTMLKNAEPIRRYHSLSDIDVDRLQSLISKSFGKNLKNDYFAMLQKRLHCIYLSEGYNAAAIITEEPVNSGTLYLDKFVVSSCKQGQGTSEMLWKCIRQDIGSLFWRSRSSNRINPWYFKQCEGSFVNGKWIVFWYGLPDIRNSYELVDYAKNMPDSFLNSECDNLPEPAFPDL